MASLIEELIMTLDDEERLYSELIPVAEKKTQVIVDNDLQSLSSITDEEQAYVSRIGKLEKKRREVIHNIGVVMNKKESDINFATVIEMLNGQEKEKEQLRNLHDRLKKTVGRLASVNERNQLLIKQSLEMIEFDINLIRSARMSPGVGQYNTSSEVEISGFSEGSFDTKQ